MRQSWDEFFVGLAQYISTRSKDPSTKCGAVIVRPDHTVCSVGYNGFPKGMTDRSEDYANREIKYDKVVHAEMNALLHAREPVVGYSLYTFPLHPCHRCMVHMIQADIRTFIAPKVSDELAVRWSESLNKSKNYLAERWSMIPVEDFWREI